MGLPDYSGLNPAYFKFEHYLPASQSRRLANAQRRLLFTPPANSPSRSQFSQGYTDPIQFFAANNTWQLPQGQTSTGRVPRQPSLRFVSPGNMAIPTRMPFQK